MSAHFTSKSSTDRSAYSQGMEKNFVSIFKSLCILSFILFTTEASAGELATVNFYLFEIVT